MMVEFKLNMFNQEIPVKVNVPDDYIEEAIDYYNTDKKIAINNLLIDEIEDVIIAGWKPVK